jgi:hypothetical protein
MKTLEHPRSLAVASARLELDTSAELKTLLDELRTPACRPSLASTFPSAGQGHRRPVHVRYTRTARFVARKGAMKPEGVSSGDLSRVRGTHRLTVPSIKTVLGTLWELRLLGWFPSDVSYMEYSAIAAIVAARTERPADTLDLIPAWFADRYTSDELRAYRDGKAG